MRKSFGGRKRKSLRLPYHDYSWPGEYFVTIVIKNRKQYFGLPHKHTSGQLILRNIVEGVWSELFDEDSRSVHHVLMPNHFHCIIQVIKDPGHDIDHHDFKARRNMVIPKLMGKFKMLASKGINDYFESMDRGRPFLWQRSYHDRVIRNERELANVYEYIEQNPYNWEEDLLNGENYDPEKVRKFYGALRSGNS